jgi:hypothetical protein
MAMKALDKCKMVACGNYAVGCIPMPLPGGKTKRFLQRNESERFCKRHHPMWVKKQSEEMRRVKARLPICRGNWRSKGEHLPFCATRKRAPGEPCVVVTASCSRRMECSRTRSRCLVKRHFNPEHKKQEAEKEAQRLEERSKRVTAFLRRKMSVKPPASPYSSSPVIRGLTLQQCDGIYPRTRAGQCQGCGTQTVDEQEHRWVHRNKRSAK